MPTIASGSSGSAAMSDSVAGPVIPRTSARMQPASATGVGWSKTAVVGSGSPVLSTSRLRKATMAIEVKPRSRKARSDGMESGPGFCSTTAACVRTRSSSSASCARSSRPDSRSRRAAATVASGLLPSSASRWPIASYRSRLG